MQILQKAYPAQRNKVKSKAIFVPAPQERKGLVVRMSMNKADAKKDSKLAKYLRSTKSEMKKIVWPTFDQVVKNTLIVLAVVIIVALIIAGLDLLFNVSLIKWITK